MRSEKRYQIVYLLLLLYFPASLVIACTDRPVSLPVSHQMAPPDRQILRLPIGPSDFDTLDPALSQSGGGALQTVFTGLVEFDQHVQVRDQLASSHDVSADGLVWTFHLRPNLRFSDGTALTSQDVVYSINRALLPATRSQVTYYLNLIKDYQKVTTGTIPTLIGDSLLAPDPNTVQIIISRPAAYFLQALTSPNSFVVEKKLNDRYGTSWTDHLNEGGGDGPFKVLSYQHTRGLFLVPNPYYYGPIPRIQKLEFLISGDQDTTYTGYLTHQYDTTILTGVPPDRLSEARGRSDFHESASLGIKYITMNYLMKPFDNIKIRQAFALSIDKDLLARTILRNAFIPTNHLVPQGMPGYDAALKGPAGVAPVSGDKNLARQLLMQGMEEEHLTTFPSVTFTYNTDMNSVVQLTQAILQMWQTVLGIPVKGEGVTFDRLSKLQDANVNNPNGLQIWISGWAADYPDPQDWLSIFFQKGSGYNGMNYGQNRSTDMATQLHVQQILAQADVNQNQAERLQQYHRAEEQIVDDVGWMPIYQNKMQFLQVPQVIGIVSNILGIIPPNDWGTIYISK